MGLKNFLALLYYPKYIFSRDYNYTTFSTPQFEVCRLTSYYQNASSAELSHVKNKQDRKIDLSKDSNMCVYLKTSINHWLEWLECCLQDTIFHACLSQCPHEYGLWNRARNKASIVAQFQSILTENENSQMQSLKKFFGESNRRHNL